jgi:hypothetical protein
MLVAGGEDPLVHNKRNYHVTISLFYHERKR